MSPHIQMGCLLSLIPMSRSNTHKCLQHLRKIDMLLQEMLSKYGRQLAELEMDIKSGIRRGLSKPTLLTKLRKKKILLHYMNQCRKKIDAIVQKQYALEQLNITAMQIEAMKGTAKVLKTFTKTHNIDKIEQLQENMVDLQEQIMEINDTIGSDPLLFDEAELMEELNEIASEPDITPVATISFPVVPENKIVNDRVALLN